MRRFKETTKNFDHLRAHFSYSHFSLSKNNCNFAELNTEILTYKYFTPCIGQKHAVSCVSPMWAKR